LNLENEAPKQRGDKGPMTKVEKRKMGPISTISMIKECLVAKKERDDAQLPISSSIRNRHFAPMRGERAAYPGKCRILYHHKDEIHIEKEEKGININDQGEKWSIAKRGMMPKFPSSRECRIDNLLKARERAVAGFLGYFVNLINKSYRFICKCLPFRDLNKCRNGPD
jgi:hypothetical protein